MALRPILADRLPLALPHAQPANELWSNQQAQKQRRRHRRSRAEPEIANNVEDTFNFQSLREQIQNKITFTVTAAPTRNKPTQFDPFTHPEPHTPPSH